MNLTSKKLAKIILTFFFGVLLVLSASRFFYWQNHKMIKIDGQKFFIEIAETSQEQALGLGKRDGMKENEGMLFDFHQKKQWAFWMKDMHFDLDMLWLENGKIVYIAKNVSHHSLEIIRPKTEADQVLEIKAGLSDKYNFKLGDKAEIY
jgi:uncharacterized protein